MRILKSDILRSNTAESTNRQIIHYRQSNVLNVTIIVCPGAEIWGSGIRIITGSITGLRTWIVTWY